MSWLGRNKVCRMVMLLCILIQGAMLLPHHHHAGSTLACFDMSHCREHQAPVSQADPCACARHNHASYPGQDAPTGDGCAHGHDTPGDACSVTAQVLDEAKNETISLDFAPLVCEMLAAETAGCEDEASLSYTSRLVIQRIKRAPDVGSLYIEAIARTLPLRAPSLEA